MANYEFSKTAEQDIRNIAQYTVQYFGVKQAQHYKALLLQSAKTVANFPSMGRPYTSKNGKVFHKHNVGEHALFYQTTQDGIFIVRVLHLMMDFDKHLD